MASIKICIYKYKRVIQELVYLKRNFINWDVILKRAVKGKYCQVLNHRKGLNFYSKSANTLSIFREVFIKKVYTNELVSIEKNDIVFDVGANIGIFSLFAASITNVLVYAFEPHPENFKLLKKNIQLNNLQNIEAINYALGIKDEARYMIEGVIPGGHKISNQNTKEGIKVKSVTLPTIMSELKIVQIDFLKLDCEGAEGEIIMSLGVEGLKKIKKVAIEFHDNNSIINHEEILEYLKQSGFKTMLKWNGKSPYGYIYGKLI